MVGNSFCTCRGGIAGEGRQHRAVLGAPTLQGRAPQCSWEQRPGNACAWGARRTWEAAGCSPISLPVQRSSYSSQVPPAAVCAAEDGQWMSPQAAQHPGETWAGAGISKAGSHLLPAASAELPNGGIDQGQGLPSSQVQKVKVVIKPRKGLWVFKTKGSKLVKHSGHCHPPGPPSGCSAGVPKATVQHHRVMPADLLGGSPGTAPHTRRDWCCDNRGLGLPGTW